MTAAALSFFPDGTDWKRRLVSFQLSGISCFSSCYCRSRYLAATGFPGKNTRDEWFFLINCSDRIIRWAGFPWVSFISTKELTLSVGLALLTQIVLDYHLAERVGFEPTVHRSAQRFSRPSDSTTLAPLRIFCNSLACVFILSLMISVFNTWSLYLYSGSEFMKISINYLAVYYLSMNLIKC